MDVYMCSYNTHGSGGELKTYPDKCNLLKEFCYDGEQRNRADDGRE